LFANNKISQYFGVVALAFCWFNIYYAPLKQVYNAIVWLPLCLYHIFKFSALPLANKRNIYFYAICLACMLLAGHPQFAFYCIFFSGLICCAYFLRLSYNKIYFFKDWLKIFKHIILAVILLVLLTAPQLYQTLKFSERTARNKIKSFAFSSDGSVEPRKIVTTIIPNLFGNIADSTDWGNYWRPLKTVHTHGEYIGILPILLVFLAFNNIRKNRKIFFVFLLAILAFVLALGKHTPLLKLFFEIIPGFDKFRAPKRIMVFYDYFMIICAVYAFDVIIQNGITKYSKKIKIIFTIIIATAILLIGWKIFERQILTTIKAQVEIAYQKKTEHYKPLNEYLNFIDIANKTAFNAVLSSFVISSLYLFFLYFYYNQSSQEKISEKRLINIYFLILIFIFEIYLFNAKFFEIRRNTEIKQDMIKYKELKKIIGDYRFYAFAHIDHLLAGNCAVFYDLYSARGYDPLVDKKYIDYMRNIETDMRNVHPNTEVSKPDITTNAMKYLNIEFFLTTAPLSQNIYDTNIIEYIDKFDDIYIYRNKNNLGYAFISDNFEILTSAQIADFLRAKTNYDDYLKKTINSNKLLINSDLNSDVLLNVLKNNISKPNNIFNSIDKSVISNINKKYNIIEITGISTKNNDLLFLSEKKDNIKEVYINDAKATALTVFNLLTAIKLPTGNFKIVCKLL